MGDGADDALRGYIKSGMPKGSKVGKACPICGKWSYTSNRCHPDQGMFCQGEVMVNKPAYPKIEPTKRDRPWSLFIWFKMEITPYGFQPTYNLCAMRGGSWNYILFDQSTLGM